MDNNRQEYLIRNIEKFNEIMNVERREAIYSAIYTMVFAGLTIYGYKTVFPVDNIEEYSREIFGILISAGLTVSGLVSTVLNIIKHIKYEELVNQSELELKILRMNDRYQGALEDRGRHR